jgi:hypothetical protein
MSDPAYVGFPTADRRRAHDHTSTDYELIHERSSLRLSLRGLLPLEAFSLETDWRENWYLRKCQFWCIYII